LKGRCRTTGIPKKNSPYDQQQQQKQASTQTNTGGALQRGGADGGESAPPDSHYLHASKTRTEQLHEA